MVEDAWDVDLRRGALSARSESREQANGGRRSEAVGGGEEEEVEARGETARDGMFFGGPKECGGEHIP